MARPDFDDSPDSGSGNGNESSTETNVGVHYNSPPPGSIQYRVR